MGPTRASKAPVCGRRFLLAFSVSTAVFAHPPHLQAQQRAALAGRILDQLTRAPVASATVGLEGFSSQVTTDSTGAFRLDDVVSGTRLLRVQHIGYGTRTIPVTISADSVTRIQLVLSPSAIALEAIAVNALSNEQLRKRAEGYRSGRITRAQIAATENTNALLPDVIQRNLPNIRVRRMERVVGYPICVELRTIRVLDGRAVCLSPKVYLDGVPINNPTDLWANMDASMVESIEVVPAAEAGARYGMGAQYGAILIETRRPGAVDSARAYVAERPPSYFNWSQDPAGHRTVRVFAVSFATNALGMELGTIAMRSCLHLRQPANDAIISDCDLLPSVLLAFGSVAAPVVGTALAARLAGHTHNSQGKLAPSILGASMAVLPGLGLVLSSKRADSPSLRAVGYTMLLVGVPAATTAADYLFRRVRE